MSGAYQMIRFHMAGSIGTIQFHRPDANNTINDVLIDECRQVIAAHGDALSILVLEGLPDVFLFGADFQQIEAQGTTPQAIAQAPDDGAQGPEALYDLWLDLAQGPYVTIAHVRGRVNAGGVGFVSACDIVIAEDGATFSLSELLFGLFPACVLPFLVRRIGQQHAHYMTLMTHPFSAETARQWGLVDVVGPDSADLLRKHLLRLRRLSKATIRRYKRYRATLDTSLNDARGTAVAGNREVFSDPENLAGIARFVKTGRFPWER